MTPDRFWVAWARAAPPAAQVALDAALIEEPAWPDHPGFQWARVTRNSYPPGLEVPGYAPTTLLFSLSLDVSRGMVDLTVLEQCGDIAAMPDDDLDRFLKRHHRDRVAHWAARVCRSDPSANVRALLHDLSACVDAERVMVHLYETALPTIACPWPGYSWDQLVAVQGDAHPVDRLLSLYYPIHFPKPA